MCLIFLLLPIPMGFQCPLLISSFFKQSLPFFFFLIAFCVSAASLAFWDRNFFFHFPHHHCSMAKLLQGWFFPVFSRCLLLFICNLPVTRCVFSFFLFCFFPLLISRGLLYCFALASFRCAGRCEDLWCFAGANWSLLVLGELSCLCFGTKGAVQLASGCGTCGFRCCCWITS